MIRSGEGKAGCVYGWLAVAVGFGLLWYVLWTATVSPLVLIGVRYAVLPWCVLTTTLLALAIAVPAHGMVFREYSQAPFLIAAPAPEKMSLRSAAILLGAILVGGALARVPGATMLTAGVAAVSISAYGSSKTLPPAPARPGDRQLLLGVVLLFMLVVALYYCGSRPDGDDANFVNLALGAQHTHGFVYQFDTMTGDGPASLHLPTYKLQSFELLGAAISTITGLTPIAALHLLLPLPQLVMLVATLSLVLLPAAGRGWLAAAIASIGFAYLNTETYGTWGIHGICRLFQGKGALVTILVPLACGLTVRYMLRRRWCDLVGLVLVHVCAVGVSANGIYVTPAASGFVALSFLLADPRRHWRALLPLPLTLAYPLAMSAIVILRHLGLPSEVQGLPDARQQLGFVTGYGLPGGLLLAPLALACIVMPTPALRRTAAIYMPAILFLTLNPWGWRAISAATGNLGFRIFWAIPAPLLAGLVWTRLIGAFVPDKIRRETPLAASLLMLIGGIAWNHRNAQADLVVNWGYPGLKVEPNAYRSAQELALLRVPGCALLVPEKEASWLSTQLVDAHLVYARELYLIHYRFTRTPQEMAVRWRLFRLITGQPDPSPLPSGEQLRKHHAELGLIAAEPANPNLPEINSYAASLGLAGPGTAFSGLVFWRGACSTDRQARLRTD